MKILINIGRIFYRIWFYFLMGVSILILFPFLIVSVARESWYPFFFKLARIWAKFILIGMGFKLKIKQEALIERKRSYMFVANHTSMTDIMLMLTLTKNPFVFVGKKELAKIPLFGFFYKRTCIMVDRSDAKSRTAVFEHAQKRLQQGLGICIFPEGGVFDTCEILCDFKSGAFRLAIEHQIPILPMSFVDNEARLPYDFLAGGSPGKMRATVHRAIETKGMTLADRTVLKENTRNIIYSELLYYKNLK